jgi:hypothetical protein
MFSFLVKPTSSSHDASGRLKPDATPFLIPELIPNP